MAIKKTNEEFLKQVEETHNGRITVLEEYVNSDTKILVRCNVCGHEWSVLPTNLLHKGKPRGCIKCAMKRESERRLKTHEQFMKEIKEVREDDITILGTYVNDRTPIKYRCNKCGFEWMSAPSVLLKKRNKKGCFNCTQSNSEKLISKILNDNNILYRVEYTTAECRYINPLRFDFALFDNNNLIALIEFDGYHHFKPVSDNRAFELQKIKDQIKNDYCTKHDIPLLRIPYTQANNIESILNDFLSNL